MLKELLSKEKPEGICTPHYSEWFGVLWSIVFDLTDGNGEICFGTPGYNDWGQFSISDPTVSSTIEANFVDKKSGFA